MTLADQMEEPTPSQIVYNMRPCAPSPLMLPTTEVSAMRIAILLPVVLLIVFGLGNPYGLLEVLVRQLGIEDGVAVVFEEGRLLATRCRGPAVDEEKFHQGFLPFP